MEVSTIIRLCMEFAFSVKDSTKMNILSAHSNNFRCIMHSS